MKLFLTWEEFDYLGSLGILYYISGFEVHLGTQTIFLICLQDNKLPGITSVKIIVKTLPTLNITG